MVKLIYYILKLLFLVVHLILSHTDILFVLLLFILKFLFVVLNHLIVAFLSAVLILLMTPVKSIFFNLEKTLELIQLLFALRLDILDGLLIVLRFLLYLSFQF